MVQDVQMDSEIYQKKRIAVVDGNFPRRLDFKTLAP